MEQWHYFYAGLQVHTHLEIPEWAGFERVGNSNRADVRIRLAAANQGVCECLAGVPIVHGGECCFCVLDVATYRVWQGRDIRVSPAPGANWREIRLYLLGSAWGALCYQRHLLVLHASAVQVGDGAVAFCAPQGMGKSTLVAWLVEAGHALVSDDLARFDISDQGRPLLYPSASHIKLRQDALDVLGWSRSAWQPGPARHDKFLLPLNDNGLGRPLPLRAIYLLAWGDPHLDRLTGRAALQRLIAAATYRGALLEPMGALGAYWQQCLELARCVPVYELQRRRDLAAMEQTVQSLQEHWSGHGPGAPAHRTGMFEEKG